MTGTTASAINPDRLARVAAALEAAESILVITGAGISADSGIPTYRGIGGLYNDRMTDENLSIEQALSSITLELRPDITWKYLWEIGRVCRQAQPNRAHHVIRAIERWKPQAWTLTQNIDGLHRAAGSQNLIEIHGRGDRLVCMACDGEMSIESMFPDPSQTPELPPRCPVCRGVVRPRVVLFGELLPSEAIGQLMAVLDRQPEVTIVVGTTAAFPYIAQPVQVASAAGRMTIEINPSTTPISEQVSDRFAIRAAAWFDALWDLLKTRNPELANLLD
ncbi:MAG TPA: NAD-dependent protein deacylase [Coleofasciculaceae cyanobacterium]